MYFNSGEHVPSTVSYSERWLNYRRKTVAEFRRAFDEDHTSHQVALSFSIGVFLTAMPTLGTGVLMMLGLAYYFAWMSKVALFCAVLILNPLVKPFVYVASYWLGGVLFGAEDVTYFERELLNSAAAVLRNLVLGNLLIAVSLAALSYFAALALVSEYRRRDIHVVEDVAEDVVETLEEKVEE